MNEYNPYAAPQDDFESRHLVAESGEREGIWRDGGVLVMDKTASLPDRCVVCSAPAAGPTLRRRLAWHAPGWYLLLLLNVGIYVIAALMVTNKAKITVGLCEEHRKRRHRRMTVAVSLLILGLCLPFACLAMGSKPHVVGGVSFLSVILVLIGALTWNYGTRVVYAKRIGHEFVWIGGVSPAFLASLPEWTGPYRA